MRKTTFFDSMLLNIIGNNTKNTRLRGEMDNFWLYVALLTTNGCCQNYIHG